MTPYDPEFDAPVKLRKVGQSRIDRRSVILLVLLIALWLWIAWGADLLWQTLFLVALLLSGVLVIGLALIPSALGFALFGACGRIVAFCRRKSRWPDEGTGAGPV